MRERAVVVCLLLAACGGVSAAPATRPPSVPAAAAAADDPLRASCARRTRDDLPMRARHVRQGSAVALARTPERLLAYVADADSKSIHTVSVDDTRAISRTPLGGTPRQLLVLDDGRLVATLSDVSRIAVLEPAPDAAKPMATLCEREMPAEPWGVALSPDEQTIAVTSAWASALTLVDAPSFASKRVVPIDRDPRSVLVDDGGVAFVSHAVGAKMTALDLRDPDAKRDVLDLRKHKSSPLSQLADMKALRTGSQGYALASVAIPVKAKSDVFVRRVLEPMVSVDPGDAERPSNVYYGPPFDGVPKQTPTVSVVDPEGARKLSSPVLATSRTGYQRECLLPRAAAVRAKTGTLLVACQGIDSVVELDASALDPVRAERRRYDVPPGPEGIAVDDESGRAVVFSQFGASVTVLFLDSADGATRSFDVDYHPDPAIASTARGRLLFYRTDDTRMSNDGLGCSSCHIDGRDDGITWSTPMGPRQTPMLAGRVAATAPYGWEGDRATLHDYVANTVKRLGGNGMRPEDLDEIASFLLAAKGPPERAPFSEEARRGHDVFEARGCANCHAGSATTDAEQHEVGLAPRDVQSAFDTPSLRFVRGTAPYFHDGRYPTLEALLSDVGSKMGTTAALSDDDRASIAAYLRTL